MNQAIYTPHKRFCSVCDSIKEDCTEHPTEQVGRTGLYVARCYGIPIPGSVHCSTCRERISNWAHSVLVTFEGHSPPCLTELIKLPIIADAVDFVNKKFKDKP